MLSSDEVRPKNMLKYKSIMWIMILGELLKILINNMPLKPKKNVENKFRHWLVRLNLDWIAIYNSNNS